MKENVTLSDVKHCFVECKTSSCWMQNVNMFFKKELMFFVLPNYTNC